MCILGLFIHIGVESEVVRFNIDWQFSGAKDREASDERASRF
jgi:hypothetical protein